MASSVDYDDASPIPDERSPLLSREDTQEQHEPEPEPELEESPKPSTREQFKRWAGRFIWAVIAIGIITVFVKGWVDAGDVDVSLRYIPRRSSWCTSLTSVTMMTV